MGRLDFVNLLVFRLVHSNLKEATSVDPEEFLRKAMNLSGLHKPTNHKSRVIRLVLVNIRIVMVTMHCIAMVEQLDL